MCSLPPIEFHTKRSLLVKQTQIFQKSIQVLLAFSRQPPGNWSIGVSEGFQNSVLHIKSEESNNSTVWLRSKATQTDSDKHLMKTTTRLGHKDIYTTPALISSWFLIRNLVYNILLLPKFQKVKLCSCYAQNVFVCNGLVTFHVSKQKILRSTCYLLKAPCNTHRHIYLCMPNCSFSNSTQDHLFGNLVAFFSPQCSVTVWFLALMPLASTSAHLVLINKAHICIGKGFIAKTAKWFKPLSLVLGKYGVVH